METPRDMNQLSLQLENGRTEFDPGETISVQVEWKLEEAPETIELRAVWNTAGKGTTDIGIEKTQAIEFPVEAGTRRVDFNLPRAPYSFSGKLISLVWALELVALPSLESCRREITISPNRKEVLLGTAAKP
jgi:hypothetical protein